MRVLLLKATATALTLGATLASALYVTAHLKNPAAPLRPAVLSARDSGAGAGLAGALVVGPTVRPTDAPPIAWTYAS